MTSSRFPRMVRVLVVALAAAATLAAAAAADLAPRADLSVTVSGDGRPAVAGRDSTYLVTVRNSGPNQADDVSVAIGVSGVGLDEYQASGCTVKGDLATCALGRLKQNDATRTVEVEVQPVASAGPASLEVTAVVGSTTGDPNEANNKDGLTKDVAAMPSNPGTNQPGPGTGTPNQPGGGGGTGTPNQPGGGGGGTGTPNQPGGGGTGTPNQPGGGGTGTPNQPGSGPGKQDPPRADPPKDQADDPQPSAPGQSFPNPPAPPAPQGEVGGDRAVSLLLPFPTVRIAGRLTRAGARLTRVTVTTPPSVRIVFDCRGRTCPRRYRPMTVAASARKRVVTVRLRAAERTYRAGTRLQVAVQRRGSVGKFTSFKIRRGKPPARTDACIAYGKRRPRPCPGS